jgi:hypothetical protein
MRNMDNMKLGIKLDAYNNNKKTRSPEERYMKKHPENEVRHFDTHGNPCQSE